MRNKILTVMGIVLITISIIGVYMLNDTIKNPTFDGPVYTPADGTEAFAFGTVEQSGTWTPLGTAIYDYNGYTVYGTLWESSKGYWMVIDPSGQIPLSGGVGSPLPEVKVNE